MSAGQEAALAQVSSLTHSPIRRRRLQILSEWMGYALFYESMLDTVLFAR
jgi:hypothetical protein